MSTKESAQSLRQAYKAKGWNSKMIGVRVKYITYDSSIDVIVKDVRISYGEAKRMAQDIEKIDRCEVTGEILGGGNCYVHVSLAESVEEILKLRHIDAVERATEELKDSSNGSIVPVDGTDAGVSKGPHGYGFQIWHGLNEPAGRAGMHCDDAGYIALQIALTDPDQR